MTIKLLWTALPNHVGESGRLRLSVHVAPRLETDAGEGVLEQFSPVAEWPQTLGGLRFRVELSDGTVFDDLTPERPPDESLWSHVFPGSTPVESFAFRDYRKRDLHVFPVREILGFLVDTYAEVAKGGAAVPSIDDPEGPLAPFELLALIPTEMGDSSSFHEELHRAAIDPAIRPDGVVVAETDPFFQAYRFYYRPGSRRDFGPDHVEKPPVVPTLDFHRRVALLGDHPELLRRLGLVLDLTLDVRPEDVAAQGSVRVTPEGDVPDEPERAPWTAYETEPGYFGPRPSDNLRMQRGLLRLNSEWFDLFQVDVDGGVLKAIGFADTLPRLRDPTWRRHDTPSEATVPALRSAGLGVARSGRGDELHGDLDTIRARNSALFHDPPIVSLQEPMFAEDVTRGYRVDVFDADAAGGPRWFSLHARLATHQPKDLETAPDGLPFSHEDEGFVKGVSASSERADNPSPSDDLYLHETLFGWEGWSLAAARPGKRIVDPGEGETPERDIARYDPDAANPDAPLTSTVEVAPGSLPRLRVGHRYRLRARLVDLAGNSLPFSEDDLPAPDADVTIPALDSEPEPYLRYEPVPSPVVLRRHPDTEGESVEHLVIRSNFPAGVTAASYAESPEVAAALTEVGAQHSYAADSQRHLAPPKASQLMAEQHGRFEPAFGGSAAEANAALRVALREEGTFLDEAIVDVGTGQKTIPQLGLTLHPSGTLPPKGEPLPPEARYALYVDDEVRLPYLPDPLAVGVSLTLFDRTGAEIAATLARFPPLETTPEAELAAALATAWPELDPFRLRLSEGGLGVNFSDGVLGVSLPKAAVVRARLSSFVPPDLLDVFAVWRSLPDADRAALEDVAAKGRHWMLTPFRWMTFTHAVQQPLEEPDVSALTHARQLGETSALFLGPIACHAGSTSRLDVCAVWTEEVDLLTDDAPRWSKAPSPEFAPVGHSGVAFGFEIAAGEDDALVTARVQGDWRRCSKCQGLVFAGHVPPKGSKVAKCPAGGVHRLDRTREYRLFHNFPAAVGQDQWRWCQKCQGLHFGGGASGGTCPSGGVHSTVGSGNYTLVHNVPEPPGQPGWRWCSKCQALVFAEAGAAPCAAGGSHGHTGSGAYALHTPLSIPDGRESRHEFGDTKYRKVTYHGVATTRFREFFPTSITDHPEKIQRIESEGHVHHVLSTARPAAPDVVYVVPAFRWERDEDSQERVHVRRGKAVRVYLRRGWFSSGDGERLAVLLRNPVPPLRATPRVPSRQIPAVLPILSARRFTPAEGLVATAPPSGVISRTPTLDEIEVGLFRAIELLGPLATLANPLVPYVTNWGSDPVWRSSPPREEPALAHFPAHTAFAANLTLEELPETFVVAAAAHDVQFDSVRKLWYCDIEIDPGETYFPFVRLALARYQPMSLPGAHLSRVVTTDFIQLVPDRTARVRVEDDHAVVKVTGWSGRNIVAEREVVFPWVSPDLQPEPPAGPNTRVRVAVEVNDGSGDDLAWRRVGQEVTLEASASGFHVTWSGQVPLPAGSVGSGAHRLLVTETEEYVRDQRETETAFVTPLIAIDAATGKQVRVTRERIVYADDFDL